MNRNLVEFMRYFVVGGMALAAESITLYVLAKRLCVHYQIAAALAFSLGLTVNYILSVTWVFTQRTLDNRVAEFLIFAAIGLVGLGLNAAVFWVFTGRLRLDPVVTKIFVAAPVILFWNYGIRKMILFRRVQPQTIQESVHA